MKKQISAILALACAAMLCGYRSYSAIAEWGRNYGQTLEMALGFKKGQTPSAATLHTALRNVAIALLRLTGETNMSAACRRLAPQAWVALALIGLQPEI